MLTSPGTASASPFEAMIWATTSSSLSLRRPKTATLAPRSGGKRTCSGGANAAASTGDECYPSGEGAGHTQCASVGHSWARRGGLAPEEESSRPAEAVSVDRSVAADAAHLARIMAGSLEARPLFCDLLGHAAVSWSGRFPPHAFALMPQLSLAAGRDLVASHRVGRRLLAVRPPRRVPHPAVRGGPAPRSRPHRLPSGDGLDPHRPHHRPDRRLAGPVSHGLLRLPQPVA